MTDNAQDLDDAQHTSLHAQLLTLQEQLSAELVQARERSNTVELDQATAAGLSASDAVLQQKTALADQRRVELRLQQVELSLRAWDDGDYGSCRRCGEPIGVRRLTARPETPFCTSCASTLGA
jgi:DnaK suppressor protein